MYVYMYTCMYISIYRGQVAMKGILECFNVDYDVAYIHMRAYI
jgi:hypothetical protein